MVLDVEEEINKMKKNKKVIEIDEEKYIEFKIILYPTLQTYKFSFNQG